MIPRAHRSTRWWGACLGLILATAIPTLARTEPVPTTFHLQIFNRTSEPARIDALASNGTRTPAGEVAPGRNRIVTAACGQRFEIVGQESGAAEQTTAAWPVQAFVFRPQAAVGDGPEAEAEGTVSRSRRSRSAARRRASGYRWRS
jgi:hypothetical protein